MKFIIILLLATSATAFSQVTSSGTLHMISVVPKNPPPNMVGTKTCMGDSIIISFKFWVAQNPDIHGLHWFHYGFVPDPNVVTIRTFSHTEFCGLQKVYVAPDTIYSFKALVPNTFTVGTIAVAVGSQFDNFHPGRTINIVDCSNLVGIEQYEILNQEPIYFDLYGNRIALRKNELIIEQVGLRRRKIIIQ